MRRSQRLIAAAVLIAFSGVLSGCSGWDPTDLLDFLDTKKKLPGDRKPVFPDGVPGLEQGVPKDLYKGAQQQQQDQQATAVAPAQAAPPPDQPPAKQAKSKSKSKQPAASDTAATQQPAEPDGEAAVASQENAAPSPKPKKVARKRTTAPPPDQSDAPAAQPAQTAQPRPPIGTTAIAAGVPGAAAERHLYALIISRHCI